MYYLRSYDVISFFFVTCKFCFVQAPLANTVSSSNPLTPWLIALIVPQRWFVVHRLHSHALYPRLQLTFTMYFGSQRLGFDQVVKLFPALKLADAQDSKTSFDAITAIKSSIDGRNSANLELIRLSTPRFQLKDVFNEELLQKVRPCSGFAIMHAFSLCRVSGNWCFDREHVYLHDWFF